MTDPARPSLVCCGVCPTEGLFSVTPRPNVCVVTGLYHVRHNTALVLHVYSCTTDFSKTVNAVYKTNEPVGVQGLPEGMQFLLTVNMLDGRGNESEIDTCVFDTPSRALYTRVDKASDRLGRRDGGWTPVVSRKDRPPSPVSPYGHRAAAWLGSMMM